MANLPISRSPGKKNDPNKNIAYSPLDTSDASSQSTNNQSAIDIINVPRPSRRQQRAIQIQIPNFQYNSFIFIITIIQIVIFLVTEAFRLKLTDQKDFRCVLYEFGSKFTPAIVTFHHFHRLFCPIFLHSGLRHLFFNLLSQIFCGFRLEKYYGTKKLMLIYLLAGVGGNLYSAIKNPHATSVGASSALFGLVALRIAYMLENYNQLGPRMKFRLLWLAFIVLGNIEGGRRSDHIDNAAHIGGFIVGALCVVIFKKESQNPNFYKFKMLAGALLTVFLMGCFGFIMNMEGLGKEANKLSDHCHKVFNI